MSYLDGHRKSGFKVGDRVKVLRSAESHENGWNNSWVNGMSLCIGKILTIEEDSGKAGFYMMEGFSYPYFVLEKVENIKVETINSSCPQCNGELVEKYSEYVGGNIQKCNKCGYC